MKKPANKEEEKIFIEGCIASYKQEMEEIEEFAPNVEDIFYSEHLGLWIVTFKNGEDMEFETRAELLLWINDESSQ